jgi:hypothetical protein
MPSVRVQLGDFTFSNLEVPEVIPWGGEQTLAIQKLVGGARVIDAMGRDDMALSWEGLFLDSTAFDRAQYLNTLRIAGQPLPLSWGELNFTVVIRSFTADFKFQYNIPYKISCEVVQDNATPTVPGQVPNVDDQMSSDMSTASGLGGLIGDSTLSGLLGTLNTAISAVSTFANASNSVIQSVLQPIAAVQARTTILLASVMATTQNIATVGGVLPNTPIAQNVTSLANQAGAFEQQPLLLNLQSTMGRMAANTNSVGTNTSTVNTAGGSLYTIAANEYGDATSWVAIAQANGMTDPQILGLQSLAVPNLPSTSGGVLGG